MLPNGFREKLGLQTKSSFIVCFPVMSRANRDHSAKFTPSASIIRITL